MPPGWLLPIFATVSVGLIDDVNWLRATAIFWCFNVRIVLEMTKFSYLTGMGEVGKEREKKLGYNFVRGKSWWKGNKRSWRRSQAEKKKILWRGERRKIYVLRLRKSEKKTIVHVTGGGHRGAKKAPLHVYVSSYPGYLTRPNAEKVSRNNMFVGCDVGEKFWRQEGKMKLLGKSLRLLGVLKWGEGFESFSSIE